MVSIGAFKPDLYLKTIYDLDPQALRRRGIRALLVDLDNTLVMWRYGQPGEEEAAWMDSVRAAGIQPCIVSNSRPSRVYACADYLQVPAVADAGKPLGRAFRRAMEILGAAPHETAVIGDQLLTDIFGGNRLGLYTILVVPVSKRELMWTRMMRRIERRLLKSLRERGLLTGPHSLTTNPAR